VLKPGRDHENKKKKGVVPSSSSASELEGEEGRRNKRRHAGRPAKFSGSGEVPAKRRRRDGKKQAKGASDYDENRDERPPPEITQLGTFRRQVCVSSRRYAVRRKP
jgi:hypothetical protein